MLHSSLQRSETVYDGRDSHVQSVQGVMGEGSVIESQVNHDGHT